MRKFIVVLICVLVLIIAASLFIEEGRRALVRLWVGPGKLELLGANPQVVEMYVNTTPTSYSPFGTTPPGPVLSGGEDTNITYILNATVYDVNGDCDGGFTWYVCTNETGTTCNSNTYTYAISNTTPAIKYGPGNVYCNYTATTFALEYYRLCGVGRVNGTARDASGLPDSMTKFWKYNGFASILFPYVGSPARVGSELYLRPDVYAGQWNEGRGANVTKNGGNIRLSLRWNATNFTGPTPFDIYVFEPPTNTSFAVDTSSIRVDGAGYINETEMYRITYPTYDIRRCGNFACNIDEDGGPNWADFTLWWHVYIPAGIQPGSYQNTIQLDASQVTSCD